MDAPAGMLTVGHCVNMDKNRHSSRQETVLTDECLL